MIIHVIVWLMIAVGICTVATLSWACSTVKYMLKKDQEIYNIIKERRHVS